MRDSSNCLFMRLMHNIIGNFHLSFSLLESIINVRIFRAQINHLPALIARPIRPNDFKLSIQCRIDSLRVCLPAALDAFTRGEQ